MLPAILVALLFAAGHIDSLRVKVVELDGNTGAVTLLLPMHNTEVAATCEPQDRENSLQVGDFYKAKIVPGELGTRNQNRVIVRTKQGPVILLIHTIRFR